MTFRTSTNLCHSDTGIIVKIVIICDMSKIFHFTCISYGEYFLSLTGNDIVMRCELLLGYFCSISSEIWVCCSWDIRLSVEWPRNFNQRSGSCWNSSVKIANVTEDWNYLDFVHKSMEEGHFPVLYLRTHWSKWSQILCTCWLWHDNHILT